MPSTVNKLGPEGVNGDRKVICKLQIPLENPAVVRFPVVENTECPRSIEWTAHKHAERIVAAVSTSRKRLQLRVLVEVAQPVAFRIGVVPTIGIADTRDRLGVANVVFYRLT